MSALKTTFSEKISIGTRSIYAEWSGQGSPIIVLDAGGLGIGCSTGAWNSIWYELADLALVCRHDRANTGRSGPTASPRSSQDMVDDLRAMLRAAGLQPPYLLVGHSFGGLNMQLFARHYPDEVAGLVLVDSVHADQIEHYTKFSKSLGDEVLAETKDFLTGVDWELSVEQVRTAPPLTPMPLVVISRGRDNAPDAQVWRDLQAELAAQLPNGRQIIAQNSGHRIQIDEPQVVITAIREMLQSMCAALR